MEGVFQWIKNITYYLLFVSLLSYLIPAGKYEQYVKLFSGAVFILLVINPLTGSLHLDTSLARAYEKIRFSQEQEEFQQKIWGIEEQQMEQLMAQYEEAVAQDVRAMAKEEGFHCISAKTRIEGQEENEHFGQVVEIALVIGQKDGQEKEREEEREKYFDESSEQENDEGKAVSIENVRIVVGQENRESWDMEQEAGQKENGQEKSRQKENGQEKSRQRENGQEKSSQRENEPEKNGQEVKQQGENKQVMRETVEEFRRKVAGYYGLEEEAVQITWQDD